MYIPDHFAQTDISQLHELIRRYPLATLITQHTSGLNANHIPMYFSPSSDALGTLHAHVARANPLLNDIQPHQEVLAIFQGPDMYITPSWYATKQESGQVVPTWNYAAVHVYGHIRAIEDATWLKQQLVALTDQQEQSLPSPWAVSDAPDKFVEHLLPYIVGLELQITRWLGKWKVSQNQPSRNQHSVLQSLAHSNHPHAAQMAVCIEQARKTP